MSLTHEQSIDEMQGIAKDAWDTTPYAGRAEYENVADQIEGDDPWIRPTFRHGPSNQATLANDRGSRRFRRNGVFNIQVFTEPGLGLSRSLEMARIILNAYEGETSPGGIIFRNVTINEVGKRGNFYQSNVVGNFEYDEIK